VRLLYNQTEDPDGRKTGRVWFTQFRYSASQRHVIACGSKALADLFCVRFFRAMREKTAHT